MATEFESYSQMTLFMPLPPVREKINVTYHYCLPPYVSFLFSLHLKRDTKWTFSQTSRRLPKQSRRIRQDCRLRLSLPAASAIEL